MKALSFFSIIGFLLLSVNSVSAQIDKDTEALFFHKLCEQQELQVDETNSDATPCSEIPVLLGDGEMVEVVSNPSLVLERKTLSQVQFFGADKDSEQVKIKFGQATAMELKSILNEFPELVMHTMGMALKLVRATDINELNEVSFIIDVGPDGSDKIKELSWLKEVSLQTQLSHTKIARSNVLTYSLFIVSLLFAAGFLALVFRNKKSENQ
jgi:hypothetical protein